MAESKRRGKDPVDDQVDDLLADEVEDDALDPQDADTDTDAVDDDADSDDARPARNGRSGRVKVAAAKSGGKADSKVKSEDGPGVFGRLARFIREIVAELRKVIWPTRKELITYTSVVVVFVTIMLTIVAGLDWMFAKGVLFVFGGNTK